MSSSNYDGRKKMEKSVEEDEVEELLKAAQDDMLLKLGLNSHMTHSSSQFSSIDPDLDSRFLALKKPHQSKSNSKSISKSKLDDTAGTTQKNPEKVLQNIDESDDLFARFAALKSSLPSYNTSVRDGQVQQQQQLMDDDGAGEEDEVEKVTMERTCCHRISLKSRSSWRALLFPICFVVIPSNRHIQHRPLNEAVFHHAKPSWQSCG
nr:uncharacterized protein LOC113716872 isoform X2 [Coffea arabica]